MPNSTAIKVSDGIKKLIPTEGINPEEFNLYAWFPVKGHSMTNTKNSKSIPDGSIVLGKKVSIDHPLSYPTHTPVVLTGNYKGEAFALIKEIGFVDAAFRYSVLCKSYNDTYSPFWIPFHCIHGVFIIEQVKRPGTTETIYITPKNHAV